MSDSDPYKTRESLIQRVSDPHDEKSWEEFISFYKGYIYTVIKNMNIADSERDELVQQTLIKLWKKLPTIDRQKDGKFRSWLSTVTKNCVIDHIRKYKRQGNLMEKVTHESEVHHTPNDPMAELNVVEEKAWKQHLTDMALESVKANFSGKAIDVFQLSLQGLDAEAIAEKMDLKVSSVYRLKTRVKTRLIEEIRLLRDKYE